MWVCVLWATSVQRMVAPMDVQAEWGSYRGFLLPCLWPCSCGLGELHQLCCGDVALGDGLPLCMRLGWVVTWTFLLYGRLSVNCWGNCLWGALILAGLGALLGLPRMLSLAEKAVGPWSLWLALAHP